jgi:hypothetical protein
MASLFRDRGDDVVVVAREQFRLPGRQPITDLSAMAGGTGAIAAAVVDPEPVVAVATLILMASQGQGALLVAFADHPQEHLPGVDGGDGQFDGFADSQAAGVDQGETAAVDGLADGRDQAAAVLVTSDVGQALAEGLADFFFVSSGQS